jgi:pentose-5-phosphate-3-epimerase
VAWLPELILAIESSDEGHELRGFKEMQVRPIHIDVHDELQDLEL